jgi:hypothetical protein
MIFCAFISFFEGTWLSSAGNPWFCFPVVMTIGILVMHRRGPISGIVWFFLAAILVPFLGFSVFPSWPYPFIGVFGVLLVLRLFSTRSIYALLGFGAILYLSYLVLLLLGWMFTGHFGSMLLLHPFSVFIFGFFFLMIGLTIGFTISRGSTRLFKNLFLIRNSHESS